MTKSVTATYWSVIPTSTIIAAIIFVLLLVTLIMTTGGGSNDLKPLFVMLGVLVAIPAGLGLHFLPSIVAWRRRHRQLLAIFVLNLFTGWTVLLWIVALVWACTTDVKEAPR